MDRTELARKTPAEKKRLLAALRQKEVVKCSESFEYWLFRYVRTKDEKDPENPVKPFPDKAYLHFLAHEFQHGPDVQYIAKSRQLMVSWLLCALGVWKIMFQPHARVCLQSKKEEDAAQMIYRDNPEVARASFIMVTLPEWMRVCIAQKDGKRTTVPWGALTRIFSAGRITLPNGAFMEALAQGPSQVESKVPTLYLGDEASLQDEWRASQAAVVPCISNGGRGITVGTMRMPSDYGDEIAPCDEVDADDEIRGVARFRSASGVPGLRVHYSADPDKDPATETGAAWFARETGLMPGGYEGSEWQQHMEICPLAVSGDRVLPFWFKIEPVVVIDDISYEQAAIWKLDSGLDFGVRNPTVWSVFANDYDGNRYNVHELAKPAGETGGIAGIAALMKQSPYFQRVNGRISADPSLWNRDQNANGGLCSRADIFAENGVMLVPAKAKGREADDVLLNRLLGYYWAGHEDMETFQPKFFLCRSCTYAIHTLPKLMYAEWKTDYTDKKEQIMSKFADFWDCAKYAESARPATATLAAPGPPPLSFDWFLRQMRTKAATEATRRS